MDSQPIEGNVVFFDGECGLCDHFVQLLVRIDRNRNLRFATLQGSTSHSLFGDQPDDPESWSIRYLEKGRAYRRSAAALRAFAAVGGVWKAMLGFLIVPAFIRDLVYRFVATHRYRWFGKLDSCMIPSPALKERFLP